MVISTSIHPQSFKDCEHFTAITRGGKAQKVCKHPGRPKGAGRMVLIEHIAPPVITRTLVLDQPYVYYIYSRTIKKSYSLIPRGRAKEVNPWYTCMHV